MSLTDALSIAKGGLSVIEKQISVTSDNISNADKPGYTRETYTATYATVNNITIAIGGTVQGSIDTFLSQQAVAQSSDAANKQTISDYLANYDNALGSTDSTSSNLSTDLNTLSAAITSLTSDSSSASVKGSVVADAETLASQLNSLSKKLQDLRLQANQDIGTSVTTINNTLDQLATINKQLSGSVPGTNTAALEDQRAQDLQSLSSQIGINYYTDNNNQVQIYTASGEQILNGIYANHMQYSPSTSVSSSTVYPGGFSGIMLQGKDITTETTTGTLGGLVQLRDSTLVNQQANLDSFANALATTVNTQLNKGASLPARPTVTGSQIFNGTDSFSATGSMRIATLDNNGNVQSYADIDLSGLSTVNDVISAINGSAAGVTASLDSTGHLSIASNTPGFGVSTNELNSSVGAGNVGVAQYFGLNDMFVATTGASNIKVSDYLSANTDYLATGTLSSSGTLANGDKALNSGDNSTVNHLVSALASPTSFATAGTFAAQSNSLSTYANSIIADAATRASNASTVSDSSHAVMDSLNTTISNNSGVNIDEETANSATLQNAYSATAQIMATIKAMFETLIQAI